MADNIFIGVDGGGTKSKLVMRDEQGALLGVGRSGASNIRLSVDKSIASVMDAYQQAYAQASQKRDLSTCKFHLGLGLAGTEVPRYVTEFLAKLPYFDTVCLKSDAYAACLGAHDGKDGAILIIGTGVIAYRIFQGEEKRVSGWGFPHDDEGGGAWIGMETIRATLQMCDGRRKSTPYLEAVYQHFQSDLTKLVTWANLASATEFASLAPIFTDHLLKGDPAAITLAMASGKALMQALDALLVKDSPLCLFGGLASFLEPYLSDSIRSHIQARLHDATEGAILMVRKHVLND
jgi:glucosamine kinase